MKDKGEAVPEGWECVEFFADGETEANINLGSWKGAVTMLCFRRRKASRSVRQVVDVCVGYAGKVPPGYEQVGKSVSGGFDGNTSRQGSGYESHVCVKYADPADQDVYHTKVSVAWIGLFLPGKGERAPGSWVERGGNLNRGMGTTRVCLMLCFGSRLGLCDLPLRPQVQDRLPLGSVWVHREGNDDGGGKGGGADVFELVFPESLPSFCFPRGVRLKRKAKTSAPPESAFNFVFTDEHKTQIFVSCLVFYEKIAKERVGPLVERFGKVQQFWDGMSSDDEEEDDEDDGWCADPESRVRALEMDLALAKAQEAELQQRLEGEDLGAGAASAAGKLQVELDEAQRATAAVMAQLAEAREAQVVLATRCRAGSTSSSSGGGGVGSGGKPRARAASTGLPPDAAVRAAGPLGSDYEIWVPQCICLTSHWPIYKALRLSLRHLWQNSLSRTTVPLERHLAAMLAVPMPRPGAPAVHLQLDLGLVDTAAGDVPTLEPIILHQPPLRGLPLMDLDFTMPFYSLSVDRVLAVLGLMLKDNAILFLSASSTRLTETIEVLRALLFPYDYKAVYIPRLPDSIKTCLEATGSYLIGMVVDPAEFGSHDSALQLVRALHEQVTQFGVMEGPGVAVVSLDEDKLYEAGGSRAKGASVPREAAAGDGSSSKDSAADRVQEDAEAMADDRRLVKEGLAMLPADGMALLKARLRELKLKASPVAAVPRPSTMNPTDLADFDLSVVKKFDQPVPRRSMSELMDEEDTFSSGDEAASAEAAVTGVSVDSVAVRDAFLGLMALCLGHYSAFLRTPDAIRGNGSSAAKGPSSSSSSSSLAGGGGVGDRQGSSTDLAALVKRLEVYDFFDMDGYVAAFPKKDQTFAREFSKTQLFISFVQQTFEESEGDVRILFFNEYCEALAARLKRVRAECSAAAAAAASASSSSMFSFSSPDKSLRDSTFSKSPALSPASGGSGGGGPEFAHNAALLTFLSGAPAAVQAALAASKPLVLEMKLTEDADSADSSSSASSTPAHAATFSSRGGSPAHSIDRNASRESSASRARASSDDATAAAAAGVDEPSRLSSSPEKEPRMPERAASSSRILVAVAPPAGAGAGSGDGGALLPHAPRGLKTASSFSFGTNTAERRGSRGTSGSRVGSGSSALTPTRVAAAAAAAAADRRGKGKAAGAAKRVVPGARPEAVDANLLAAAAATAAEDAEEAAAKAAGLPFRPSGNVRVTRGTAAHEKDKFFFEYPRWPRKLDPVLVADLAALPAALMRLREDSAHKDRGFNARQLGTRSKGERRKRGSVMAMDPLHKAVYSLSHIVANYISRLPARMEHTKKASASRGSATASPSSLASGGSNGGGGGGGNGGSNGGGGLRLVEASSEPVRELLRSLGLLFHLEKKGHAKHLDEAAWRSLFIACGRVGGPTMQRLAVRIMEAFQKALGRSPNPVTLGQFHRALTVERGGGGGKKKKKGRDVVLPVDELASWVPVALAGSGGGGGGSGGRCDPFLWLEVSGILWTRINRVEGLWQTLVDRVTCAQLRYLFVSHIDPVYAPGRSIFSELSNFEPGKPFPSERYPPWNFGDPVEDWTGRAADGRAADGSGGGDGTGAEGGSGCGGGGGEETGAVAARLYAMWSDSPCTACGHRLLDEEIHSIRETNQFLGGEAAGSAAAGGFGGGGKAEDEQDANTIFCRAAAGGHKCCGAVYYPTLKWRAYWEFFAPPSEERSRRARELAVANKEKGAGTAAAAPPVPFVRSRSSTSSSAADGGAARVQRSVSDGSSASASTNGGPASPVSFGARVRRLSMTGMSGSLLASALSAVRLNGSGAGPEKQSGAEKQSPSPSPAIARAKGGGGAGYEAGALEPQFDWAEEDEGVVLCEWPTTVLVFAALSFFLSLCAHHHRPRFLFCFAAPYSTAQTAQTSCP